MDDYVFKRYPMYDRVYICISLCIRLEEFLRNFPCKNSLGISEFCRSRARSDGLVICTVIHVFNVNHFF